MDERQNENLPVAWEDDDEDDELERDGRERDLTVGRAREWLRQELEHVSRRAADLMIAARKAGFSEETIRRARELAPIIATIPDGVDLTDPKRRWFWVWIHGEGERP